MYLVRNMSGLVQLVFFSKGWFPIWMLPCRISCHQFLFAGPVSGDHRCVHDVQPSLVCESSLLLLKKHTKFAVAAPPLGPLKIWVILRSKDFLVVTAMSSVKGIPSLATTLKWCPLIKLAPRGWFWYNDALWVVGEFSFVYLSNIYIYIY